MHVDKLYQGLNAHLHVYNHTCHNVTGNRCDLKFTTTMDTVKDGLGVHMNYTATGEHEPVSERNNHTFKDHIIPIYHYLPFRIIPKLTVSKTTTTSKNV